MEELKYPIGRFQIRPDYELSAMEGFTQIIREAPQKYRTVVQALSESDLQKTYRPDSWNIAQLVHHVADMQLLHYFRMKKVLTEPDYTQTTLVNIEGWAQLPDAMNIKPDSVKDSLNLFDGVHHRFYQMIQSLTTDQLNLTYFHPVRQSSFTQKQAIALAAWHVEHHLAHIQIALK